LIKPHSKVTLREVTTDNLGAILALEVFEERRNFVASNARSIAQAQKLGFGRRAVRLLIEHVKQRPNAKTLLSSFRTGQNSPERFYAKLGFKRTGNEHDGEIEIGLGL